MSHIHEKLFPAIREIGKKADRLIDKHNRLRPKYGTMPMGSSWMSPFFISEALLELLSHLRRGETIDSSVSAAKKHARLCIKKWNDNPRAVCINHKSELWFWDGHCDDAIESAERLLAGVK